MNILICVREYGGAYIARTRIAGKKIQASSTSSDTMAARAVAKKVLGNYEGDEPRLVTVGINQYAADALLLEGFDTTASGECCKCGAKHRVMFKRTRPVSRSESRTYCGGCAVRERQKAPK